MQQAFILNLDPGTYSIRLVNPDGTVMEGSEKTVIVHDRSRTNGIGFEVIPSDRWTRPESSVTPSSVLYVDGSADLYLRPFFEEEFNDLAYEKTLNNAARGNPNIAKWVRIQQVPHATIEVDRPGSGRSVLTEQPYFVEQAKGSSLGYTIQPYDPAGAHKDKEPNLIAFRVPVDRKVAAIRFHALDGKGERLAGSERELRVVGRDPGGVAAARAGTRAASRHGGRPSRKIPLLHGRQHATNPERQGRLRKPQLSASTASSRSLKYRALCCTSSSRAFGSGFPFIAG